MTAPERLTAALADRYRLERELGAGGMATVYLAEDLKHHRRVAIKVLRPELAAAIGPERFLREIETTAALHHPHILALYDSGEAAGFLYYVMPFVEGESLRDRLDREKQLPLDEALQIAREVADALSYAHSRGVIHRDIKPENILLESGHAVVADFGIARAVVAAGGERLTQTGVAVGTPSYMSPEQGAGSGELDGRTDLYSLGCVLYEMLAGQPPFTGPTVESVVHQHLTAEPRAITELRPAVPAEIAGVLQRVLAKNPADRLGSATRAAQALADAGAFSARSKRARRRAAGIGLRRPALVAIAVLAGLVVVAGALVMTRGNGRAGPERRSVAVLPFRSLGGDTASDYFGDGITEDIIAQLSRQPALKVIGQASATRFRAGSASPRRIGEVLDVATILDGTVRRAGSRVRIVAQLIDARTSRTLWANSYDRELRDIFEIQSDVARNIAVALGAVLSAEAGERRPTADVEAYQLYLRGRHLWNQRTGRSLEAAVDYFRRAIERDSGFAQAYAALAETWVLLPTYALTPVAQAFREANRAADLALARDSQLAEALAAKGFSLAYYGWEWSEGEALLRRAIAANPGYAGAHHWLAMVLTPAGRFDEALAAQRRALELDPLSPIVQSNQALIHFMARRHGEAEAQFRRTLELEPRFPTAHWRSAWVYAVTGRDSAAAEALERWNGLAEEPLFPAGAVRAALNDGGRVGMYETLVQAAAHGDVADTDRAWWLAAAGRVDDAVVALARAVDERVVFAAFIKRSPLYDSLRGHPRFEALLGRIDVP